MFLGQPPQGPAWGKGFVKMSWNVIFLPKAPTVLPSLLGVTPVETCLLLEAQSWPFKSSQC